MKAEERFFDVFSEVLDTQIERSKYGLVYANWNFNQYIENGVKEALHCLKDSLNSTNDFSNKTLPVDCVLRNHRTLGTRVIEFDEYQHFTNERKLAIDKMSSEYPLEYHERYLTYFKDPEVMNTMIGVTNRAGFHKAVPGFNFDGGRMVQRAFFDTLKDYIHFMNVNDGFMPIIRFALPDFGVNSAQFLRMDKTVIKNVIEERLDSIMLREGSSNP